ncbi:hypothetical protein ZWY2020_026693 [Hordeum vulgare]|nr:hypothetical protein ZWY2020_026683 [Hordeum vulgare]KAI5002043.1 hypothetical protein ZWY2020_026693 [Hordeum vulgare]
MDRAVANQRPEPELPLRLNYGDLSGLADPARLPAPVQRQRQGRLAAVALKAASRPRPWPRTWHAGRPAGDAAVARQEPTDGPIDDSIQVTARTGCLGFDERKIVHPFLFLDVE